MEPGKVENPKEWNRDEGTEWKAGGSGGAGRPFTCSNISTTKGRFAVPENWGFRNQVLLCGS